MSLTELQGLVELYAVDGSVGSLTNPYADHSACALTAAGTIFEFEYGFVVDSSTSAQPNIGIKTSVSMQGGHCFLEAVMPATASSQFQAVAGNSNLLIVTPTGSSSTGPAKITCRFALTSTASVTVTPQRGFQGGGSISTSGFYSRLKVLQ